VENALRIPPMLFGTSGVVLNSPALERGLAPLSRSAVPGVPTKNPCLAASRTAIAAESTPGTRFHIPRGRAFFFFFLFGEILYGYPHFSGGKRGLCGNPGLQLSAGVPTKTPEVAFRALGGAGRDHCTRWCNTSASPAVVPLRAYDPMAFGCH